jgi:hypothetical protein
MQPIVHVIATTFEGTRAAIAAAVPLAKGAGARLVVIVPRIVSYAVELDSGLEPTAFFAKRYRELVEERGGAADIDVCLCRSIEDVVTRVAKDKSRVVIGGPAGRWLTSPEERFANRLIHAGCPVVFVACGTNPTQRRVPPGAAALLALAALLVHL